MRKVTILIFAFYGVTALALVGCAQLTGDPLKDCLAARNAVLQAQNLATLAHAIALSNPASARDQEAAALADAVVATTINTQTAVCPAPTP